MRIALVALATAIAMSASVPAFAAMSHGQKMMAMQHTKMMAMKKQIMAMGSKHCQKVIMSTSMQGSQEYKYCMGEQ